MINKELNPYAWFGVREVTPNIPRHFVKAHTPVTTESKQWVLTSLHGRYGVTDQNTLDGSLDWKTYIFFEDPSEAMIYELRWSGNN
jgi:hypothetical protein